jgi:DNA-binding response OmpR family regulator
MRLADDADPRYSAEVGDPACSNASTIELSPEADVTARVLVVEDDPKIAAMIEKGLRARRLEVETVKTGFEAVARVKEGGIDVQLLDLGLPDMDGLDLLRLLHDVQPSVPVIVLTARSDPRDRQTAIDLGVSQYVTKPFDWSHLWAAIDACVADRPAST